MYHNKINIDMVMSVETDDLHEPVPAQIHGKYDDITGEPLDPVKVAKGRATELRKMKERRVYDPVPKWQADQDMDGKYIKTRWVETVKDGEARSHFVACKIAAGDLKEDLFAGHLAGYPVRRGRPCSSSTSP